MESINEITGKVFGYIKKNSFVNKIKVDENTMIFKEGIFDSMGFVQLIDFLEETFGVCTQDEDMIEENFESINAITQYVLKKQKQSE